MHGQCSFDGHEHVVIHATLQPKTGKAQVQVVSTLCTIDGTTTLDEARGTLSINHGADAVARSILEIAHRLTRESVERTLRY